MLKIFSGLFSIINSLLTLFNKKQIGDAAIAKVELSADEKEIKEMRDDKDFSDKLTPAAADKLRDKLNERP